MSKNVTKFITPRVVCTNNTNRVLIWFDRFTASYQTLNKNVRKLISPGVLCRSVTNRVVCWFDRFMAYYYGMSKNGRKLTSSRVYCSSITNRVLSWFDRFTGYYYCMNKNFQKTHISTSFVHKCHKSHFYLIWPFLWLNTTVREKMLQNSYLHELCAQISKIVFLPDLTVLRLITTVWAKNLKKLISPRVLCTTITNRVFSWFDHFTSY